MSRRGDLDEPLPRTRRALARAASGFGLALSLMACANPGAPQPGATEVVECGGIDRAAYLEREIQSLSEDLREAEAAMVAIESGLRGELSQADAVSALAEARIAVERASRDAPWRKSRIREAQQKLEEAERQYQAGHTGSAIFFASRSRRIADSLSDEARCIAGMEGIRFVRGRRINLRAGASMQDAVVDSLDEATPVFPEQNDGDWVFVHTPWGRAGWIHESLLRER